jgi:putative endonuclease
MIVGRRDFRFAVGEQSMGNKFYTYVLLSKKDGGIYIGQTNCAKTRLRLHNAGKVISTRNRKPFILILAEEYETRNEAYRREQFLKTGRGREWLQEYVKESARGGLKNL